MATRYVLAAGTLLAQVQGGTAHFVGYDAFGVLQHGSSAPGTTYRYTGQQYDAATGLYSLRARYYQPADGRFLTRDTYPIDVQHPVELNRYGYTANNPVNGTDPSGEVLVGQVLVQEKLRRKHVTYMPIKEVSKMHNSLSIRN
ncbi:MAG: RHS repeat-associated core domain-containing protein [Blastochloris sp.]|nr:RHS repeat-associated core domain-containing protein [Blastochloris sp.]